MESLPNELLLKIFNYLFVIDIFNTSLINKKFNTLTNSDYLWKIISKRDWGYNIIKNKLTWKETYKHCHLCDYIVVVIASNICIHSKNLMSIWNNIKQDLNKEFQTLQFQVFIVETLDASKNEFIPKNLHQFCKWYPFLFLISRNRWNEAMAHNTEIKRNDIQIMNCKEFDYKYKMEYNFQQKKEINRWINDSLKLEHQSHSNIDNEL